MPGQAASTEIGREADDHIALGLLLRRDRQEPRKGAVQKVLSSNLSTAQKVEKIREIDETKDSGSVLRVVRRAAVLAAHGRMVAVSRAIKRPVSRRSYFSFLLGEYGKVRKWGRRTHVLSATVLPPGIRMDAGLPNFLVKELQAWAHELSARLKVVAELGWAHLTPHQYNYVVLLKRLSDRLRDFDFLHMDLRDPALVDRFRRVESLFLMLHYHRDSMNTLLGALRLFYERQRDSAEEGEKTQRLAMRILSEDVTLPSLYNILLGLNIFRRRRLLEMKDLVQEGLGDMVDSRAFDCDPQVRERMEKHIDECVESISKVHGQLQESRRVNSYILQDPQGRPSDELLRALYLSVGRRGDEQDYDRDLGNLVVLVPRLLRAFDAVFSPLLNGQVGLEGNGKVTIFARPFFEEELTRLRNGIGKLEQGPFHFSTFPLDRYLKIKGERTGTIWNEVDVSIIIDEAVAGLVDLGKTLTRVMGLRLPTSPSNIATTPLESVVLQGKVFSLPYENMRISSRSLLGGRTVAEAVTTAVQACFTAGLVFHDDFLSLYQGKEKRLAEALRQKMGLMQTLLDQDSYRDLAALYS